MIDGVVSAVLLQLCPDKAVILLRANTVWHNLPGLVHCLANLECRHLFKRIGEVVSVELASKIEALDCEGEFGLSSLMRAWSHLFCTRIECVVPYTMSCRRRMSNS